MLLLEYAATEAEDILLVGVVGEFVSAVSAHLGAVQLALLKLAVRCFCFREAEEAIWWCAIRDRFRESPVEDVTVVDVLLSRD